MSALDQKRTSNGRGRMSAKCQ